MLKETILKAQRPVPDYAENDYWCLNFHWH